MTGLLDFPVKSPPPHPLTHPMVEGDFLRCSLNKNTLLRLCGETGLDPPLPSTLEGEDVRKTHLYQFLCHPDTGVLESSSQNESMT